MIFEKSKKLTAMPTIVKEQGCLWSHVTWKSNTYVLCTILPEVRDKR